jgi:hypothetical protein
MKQEYSTEMPITIDPSGQNSQEGTIDDVTIVSVSCNSGGVIEQMLAN